MELTSEGSAGRTLASGRRNGRLTLGVTPYLLEKRYGRNTSNLVEAMKKWILEERRLSVLDILHSLWSKCIDPRFWRLQETQNI